MSINLTLLVQIIHFLLAYWLLRRFLFVPIVQALQQEEAEQRQLKDRLHKHEQNVEKAEEVKHAEWRECHESLKSKKPLLASPAQFVPPIPSLEQIELPQEKRHEIISQLSEQIAHSFDTFSKAKHSG